MQYDTEKRTCDICGSSEFKSIHTQAPHMRCLMIKNDSGEFVHNDNSMCMNCGLIMKPETMTRESLISFYVNDYNRLYKGVSVDSISRKSVVETAFNAVYVCDWLREIGFNFRGKRSLDIGSGDGMFVRAQMGEGSEAYGLEISKDAAKISKKIHGFEIAMGDIMEGVVITNKFDFISIRNVLEHVYSAKEFLSIAMEMINDNGSLLIEVPSADRPYPGIPVDGFLSAAHIYTYTIDSFRKLADACGMYVDKFSYKGHKSCMLILLKKGKANPMNYDNPKSTYTRIKNIFTEHNQSFLNISKKIKELLEESYVNSIIQAIKQEKSTSNMLVFGLLINLMQCNGSKDIITSIFDAYKWDNSQAYDLNCCEGSYEYCRGLLYKETGDFKTAQKCFKLALDLFPHIMDYNFIRELRLDGVLSDTVLNESMWFTCLRNSKAIA